MCDRSINAPVVNPTTFAGSDAIVNNTSI